MDYNGLCQLIMNISSISQEVYPDSKLSEDLGLCSFDLMLLIFQIEEIINISIDVTKFTPEMTVADLSNIISDTYGGIYG